MDNAYTHFFRYPSQRYMNIVHCNSANETQTLTSVANKLMSCVNQNYGCEYGMSHVAATLDSQHVRQFVRTLVRANSSCNVQFNTSVKQLVINRITNLVYDNQHGSVNHIVTEAYMDVPQCVYNQVDLWEDDSTENLLQILTPDTRVLLLTHVCHMTGRIFDLRSLIAKARKKSPHLFVIVDGSLYVPHRHLDFDGLGADMYTFSFKRFYGPQIATAIMHEPSMISINDDSNIEALDHQTLSIPGVAHFVRTVSLGHRAPPHIHSGTHTSDVEVFYDRVMHKEHRMYEELYRRIACQVSRSCAIVRDDDEKKNHVPIIGLRFIHKTHREAALFLNECNVLCDHVRNEFLPDESRDLVRLSLAVYNELADIDYVVGVLRALEPPFAKSKSYTQLVNDS